MIYGIATVTACIATPFALWASWIVLYRLFLHPLSKVPGPKIAALSRAYELYYDLVKGGRLPWKIQELHHKYGPVIRLAPNEVHIADAEYAPKHFNSRANKYAPYQHRFGFPEATSETIDSNLHRMRYAALAPVFSKRAVLQLEPVIADKIEKVCQHLTQNQLHGSSQARKPIQLRHLLLCMTTDILTAYAFPFCFDLLDDPALSPQFYDTLNTGLRHIQWFKHFPVLWGLMRSKFVSHWLGRLVPGFGMIQKFEAQNKESVKEAIQFYARRRTTLSEPQKKHGKPQQDVKSNSGNITVFERLLASDLPEPEKNFERLWQEGSSLMGAGTETVANLLTFILVQLHLDDCGSLIKLKAELVEAIPDASRLPTWTELEALPYLTAVINEGLRMGLSVVERMLRVLPADAVVGGYALPMGTVVGMSTITLHMDEKVWPSSHRWSPDRFLGPQANGRKDLYSFSKGPRACAGMNLAYAQLYLTLAAVVRRFELRLFETSLDDVEPYYDGIVALTRETRARKKGVQLVVL